MNNNYTFKEFYYQVYRPHHPELDVKTRESRETLMMKYVFNDIGNLLIQDIDVYTINDYLRNLSERDLSDSTSRQIFEEIRRTFKLAVCKGIIQQQRFPCFSKRISHPRACLPFIQSSAPPESYTMQELKSLSESLGSDQISLMFRLALYAGLKQDEIQALTISDYNPQSKILCIKKALRWSDRNYHNHTIVLLSQADRKRRSIFLTLPAQKVIEQAIQAFMETAANTSDDNDNCFIFRNRIGNPHSGALFCAFARKIEQKSKVQHISIRRCRNTFIVLCFQNGWSETDVMEYLGFSAPLNVLPYKRIAMNASEASNCTQHEVNL